MNRRTPEWALDSGPIDQLVVAVQEKPKPEARVEMTEQSKDALWKALAEAQDRAKAVGKDARNEYARYDYTSSESIIRAANEQLNGSGLSVIPARSSLQKIEAEWILHRTFVVSHSTGQSIEMNIDFPVIVVTTQGKPKPLDKAHASALTMSYAYFLRDLLRIPRVDAADDELHHHEEPEPQRRPAKERKERRPTPHESAPAPQQRDTGRTKSEERRAATAEFDQQSKESKFEAGFREATAKHPQIGPHTKIDKSFPLIKDSMIGMTIGECVEWQEACAREARAIWPDINGADKAVVYWALRLHKQLVKGATK